MSGITISDELQKMGLTEEVFCKVLRLNSEMLRKHNFQVFVKAKEKKNGLFYAVKIVLDDGKPVTIGMEGYGKEVIQKTAQNLLNIFKNLEKKYKGYWPWLWPSSSLIEWIHYESNLVREQEKSREKKRLEREKQTLKQKTFMDLISQIPPELDQEILKWQQVFHEKSYNHRYLMEEERRFFESYGKKFYMDGWEKKTLDTFLAWLQNLIKHAKKKP